MASEVGSEVGAGGPWLLIGNSRWHWARGEPASLHCWHEQPAVARARLLAAANDRASEAATVAAPLGWAAVGEVPADLAPLLLPQRRLTLAAVPLAAMPAWLGIDRALVGWGAWQQAQARGAAAVLVADAGTVLSLTHVRGGRFGGGRLQAGVALQWRAMAAQTAQLPPLAPLAAAGLGAGFGAGGDPWPQATAAAMRVGVLRGLAAAIAAAWAELPAGGQGERRELWLTGGDGPLLEPLLEPLLRSQGLGPLLHAPQLALASLAALS